MSRYTILLILNTPFILAAILNQITLYKLNKSSKSRLVAQLLLWLIIFVGLFSAQYIYNWLYANNFTATDSLSLFDVIQITAIVALYYIVNRLRQKTEILERKFNDLHQELSIKLMLQHDHSKHNK